MALEKVWKWEAWCTLRLNRESFKKIKIPCSQLYAVCELRIQNRHSWVLRVCVLSPSVLSNSAASWTVAHKPPLSMEFFRQEYWSGLPFPSPGDLPNPGIKPRSPALQTDSLPSELPGKPWVLWDVDSKCQGEGYMHLNIHFSGYNLSTKEKLDLISM